MVGETAVPLDDQRTEIFVIDSPENLSSAVVETEMIADPKRKPHQDNGDSDERRRQEEALDDRERRIFEARRLAVDPITLAELADEFGVSRERVRQIGVCALEKVQKAVKNRVAAIETPASMPVH